MRIGYYIPGWPPESVPNGIATAVGCLGRQLRAMGHEVFYVTPYSNGRVHDQCVTVLDFSKNSTIVDKVRFKWNFEATLFRQVSKGIADAVEELVQAKDLEIFQMEETHGWASAVVRRVPIPVVVKLDGPWFLHGPLQKPLASGKAENRNRVKREGEAIRHAAGLTAPSNNVINLSQTFYGQPKCPTQVIPNPVPVRIGAARWSLDTCDRNLMLFVGRFDRHKGADILLRTFATLAQERPAIRLLFVGPDIGLQTDDGRIINFAEFVEREIPATVRERIDYCGVLPHSEIEKLRVQAYLTVVCSRYENFPNTVLEAMSTGCPTVATGTGGIPEILVDNRNGFLAPVEDVSGLAAAIAKMLDNPSLAVRLGEQATYDCWDWFQPAKIAEQAVNFYSAVCESHEHRQAHGAKA
jgi:glycosyltransferase involved in cell wall biosynthesis